MDTAPTDLACVPADSDGRIQVLARVSTYAELRRAVAARRYQLGLSQLVVDELAGLPSGYLGKIEGRVRHFGDISLDVVLATLGLELLLIPTELPPTVQSAVAERQQSETGRERGP